MTRILHFADLHLERSFGGLGMTLGEAERRRRELRSALERIVELALKMDVDAVTVAGDLYVHERATAETGRFIAGQLRRLAPRPVFLAPGNHDPFLHGSLYEGTEWPANVRIFKSMTWTPATVGETYIWGAGHTDPCVQRNLMRDLRLQPSDTAIALLHGTELGLACSNGAVYCPFDAADVERSGAAFALLGHEHVLRLSPSRGARYAYPGSPEPLGFYTAGSHYVLLITASRGSVSAEPIEVGRVCYRTECIDVTGMGSARDMERAIIQLAGSLGPAEIVRIVLGGRRDRGLSLDAAALQAACGGHFRYLEIIDGTEPAWQETDARPDSRLLGRYAMPAAIRRPVVAS